MATVVASAAAAIITGQAEVVVVYRVLDADVRYGKVTGAVTVGGVEQFAAPHGYLVPPQWFAMWARRHQHEYGSTCEDLGAIAINNRAHAVNNPHAIARDPITLDDYLDGRWVVEPFRVFDCAYEVDGAVALVLTGADRAADLRHPPVYPIGVADATGAGGMPDLWDDQTADVLAPRRTPPLGAYRPAPRATSTSPACTTASRTRSWPRSRTSASAARARSATTSARAGRPTAATSS